MGKYTPYHFPFYTKNHRYRVYINSKIALGASPSLYSSSGSFQCVGLCRIIDSQSPSKVIVDSTKVFESDTIAECESFVSWVQSRFTRFFVAINISKLNNILTDDCFRFVPAPPSGKFDHIYTDEELYKAFNLPQKYIDVIEAVIKERK